MAGLVKEEWEASPGRGGGNEAKGQGRGIVPTPRRSLRRVNALQKSQVGHGVYRVPDLINKGTPPSLTV